MKFITNFKIFQIALWPNSELQNGPSLVKGLTGPYFDSQVY